MEPSLIEKNNLSSASAINPIITPTIINPSLSSIPKLNLCVVCHQPLLPQYYFCPNCGTKVKENLCETTVLAQVKMYALSIFLPMVLFVLVGRWHVVRYLKSDDPKARRIGQISVVLVVISTIFNIWLYWATWNLMTTSIQSSINNSINTDFPGL